MKLKTDGLGEFWYYVACVLSLGVVFFMRNFLTIAIKRALADIEQ